MQKYLYTFILVLLWPWAANAQQISEVNCGTEQAMRNFYERHPSSLDEAKNFNTFTKSYKQSANGRVQAAQYTIPVVFHVFGTDFGGKTVNDNTVITALEKTNEDFRGLNDDFNTVDPDFSGKKSTLSIEFKLAQIDPKGNATSGIIYYPPLNGFGNGGTAEDLIPKYAWDNYKYMNVYIQLDLNNDGSTTNSGVAWYPDTYMSNNGLARVVYNGRYLYGNTDKEFASVLTHEFGHYLNLIHTFEGGCTYPNDEVTDTPPTLAGVGCSNVLNCEGKEINGENYMDYNVTCYKMFTIGQINRMSAALQHPARQTLWQPANLVATGVSSSLGPRIVVGAPIFREGSTNNGSIQTTVDLTINQDSWSAASGNMTQGTHYTVANVPAGLSVQITRTSSTAAKMSLVGNATSHAESNNLSNLQVTFLNAALASGNANGLFKKTLTFDVFYKNPYSNTIKYSTAMYDVDDIVINSSNTWKYFTLGIGNSTYGGWYLDGKLKLETYMKSLVCQGTTRNVTPLPFGTTIGSSSNWVAGAGYPNQHDIRSSTYTTWHGQTAYIGIQFIAGEDTYYGWIKAAVSSTGATLTLLEYAYHETPGTSIKAGQTSVTAGDTQAPSVPSNLAASNVTQTSIQLNWTASTDNVGVTSYDVYRGSTLAGSASGTTLTVSGLTANTTYTFTVRAKDAAGNTSASSTGVSATTLPSSGAYCGVSHTSTLSYFYIQNVRFGTIDNNTTLGNVSGYSDHTSVSTAVTKGTSYSLSLTSSTTWTGNSVAVYIDWNKDGDFVDAGETVLSNTTAGPTYTASVLIPSTATIGNTRMRVRLTYNASITPCNTLTYGETEDYTLSISSGAVTYCTLTGTNSTYEWIAGVSINGMTNNSGASAYTDYTSKVVNVDAGATANILLTPGFRPNEPYDEVFSVWIDYNKDGDFSDAGESVYTSPKVRSAVNGSFTVPSSAYSGHTRMRVAISHNSAATSCGSIQYGEAEDYTVNVSGGLAGPNGEETQINAYPNPSNGTFQIVLSNKDGSSARIKVLDSQGKVVKEIQEQITSDSHAVQIQVNNTTSGLYYLHLMTGRKRSVHKLIFE